MNFGDMWPGLVGGAVGVTLALLLKQRREIRNAASWRLECTLRVVSGGQPGLTSRWRHVTADVLAGELDCQGWWWHPARFQVRDARLVRDAAGGLVSRERSTGYGTFRILQLRTPSATLEWSFAARHESWAVTALDQAPRARSST